MIVSAIGFGQVKYAVQLGTVLVNGSEEYKDPADHTNNYTFDMKAQPGILLGGVVDIPFNEEASLRTGVNLNYENSKISELGYVLRMHAFYADVPVSLLYHIKLGAGKVLIGGGANVGIGFSGTYSSNQDQEGDIVFDGKNKEDDDIHYKRVNFGLGVSGGYQVNKHIFFDASYIFGISNLSPYDNTTDKMNQLNLKIGYFL